MSRCSPATTRFSARWRRRYTAETFLRRVEHAEGFNLTSDVIVGFPGEDEAAFERTLGVVERAGITKVHVFPYSPRPGTKTAAADTVPPAVKKERGARLREASRVACVAHWRRKLGREDVVLVDRPGRGYGDDYSPWLVDGSPEASSARRRAPSPRRGSSLPDDCLFCTLYAEGDHVHSGDGFVAIRDINPQADVHLLVLPERHISSFKEIGEFPADGGQAHARVRRRHRRAGRARGLPPRRARRPTRGPDGLPPPLAHSRFAMSLIARIEDELKEAMQAREAERRDALRLILAALRSAEKELQRPLHDDEELQVLQRERKRRIEAADAFRAAGREEQAEAEENELDILEEFMPEPLSEAELEEIVDDAIAEVGATSMRDIGRVMADVMPQIAGRADGSAVSQLVREKLA